MDISAISAAVVALLSPYLAKAGEEVAKQASTAAWKKLAEIHQMIKARFKKEKDDFPAKTLEQFEKNPEKRKGALQDVLVEILEKDPDLATSLLNLLKETEKADPGFITQVFGGEVGEIFNISKVEGGIKIDKRPKK
jgi:hypothetical protein